MEVELVRVLETLPGMVSTALSDGSIDFMNRNLVEFLGRSESATSWPIAASFTDAQMLTRRWNSLVSGSEPFELTLSIMHPENGSRDLKLHCNPMVENDRVEKWYGVATECSASAWHASDRETSPRRILLKSDANGGEIGLSIEDTGGGFGPLGSEKIFDAFYSTKPDGMGIGLSVSRSILENYNGRLWAKPNHDHGYGRIFGPDILGRGAAMRRHVGRRDDRR